MEHQHIATNGIQLHVVQDGPKDGALVILLHGFPEFWYGCRNQIPFLAAAGYWVWAPDQRGYNLSDKPKDIAAYNLDELAADVVGLIDAAGREKAVVVGHDWGASVAWWLGIKHPSRLEKLVILNGPHLKVMSDHLRRSLRQMRKSWYILFFQIPRLPEFTSRLNNWQQLVRAVQGTARPGTFNDGDMETYRRAWSQPGAYSAMVNWYRAAVRHPPRLTGNMRVTVPTLMIWGVQDAFLGREMAQPSIEMCDNGRLVLIEEATHWVQHEEADRVNELIDSFLRGRKTS